MIKSVFSSAVLACVFLFYPVLSHSVILNPIAVDWSHSFLLNDLATGEAKIRVAFYPPDPITPSDLNLSDPSDVALTYSSSNPASHILFAISGGGQQLFVNAPGAPVKNLFEFDILDVAGALQYSIKLDILTSSNGLPVPGSWVAFNPQPEPPALPVGSAAIGFDFNFSSLSAATMRMQVFDPTGAALSFSAVPLPATAWLFASGLLGILGMARRKTV